MNQLFEVTIEITQRCPNRCIYCSSRSSSGKKEALDLDTIVQVIDDAALLGAKQINLSGGEPLLRADIVEIAEYVHAKGLVVRLYTSGINGGRNARSIPVQLMERLKGKIDCMIFNYEACSPKLYAQIMGTSTKNMSLLDEAIQYAVSIGIPVEAHIVSMKSNFREIPATVEKLYSMGIGKVSLLRLVPQGRAGENEALVTMTQEEQSELRQLLSELPKLYGERLRLGKPYCTGRYTSCYTGTVRLAVRYDGYVFPCGAFKDGMEDFESSKPINVKVKRLTDIYDNSAYIVNVRKGLARYYEGEVNEPCYGQYCRENLK